MSVNLEIVDGNPWWLSPDLWTVPGNDPEGAPGQPVVGQNCFLWARVRNTGISAVENAAVRFYWANPAVGFDRSTANLIGTSFVSLDPGGAEDVLCLTPWNPVFVNGGHECILAEAFHPGLDPLPPTLDFNVPSDRHVAQRNLSVLLAARRFSLAFEVHNPSRKMRTFTLNTRQDDPRTLRPLLKTLGRDAQPPAQQGKIGRLGFVLVPCPEEEDLRRARPEIKGLEVGPGARAGVTLVGELEGPAALVHVTQTVDNRVVGGLSALVLRQDREKDHQADSVDEVTS